jgi:rod shape-determining protein MreB
VCGDLAATRVEVDLVCAIDVGASKTRVALQGKGLIYDSWSVVAVDAGSSSIRACGEAAYDLVRRSGGRHVIKAPFGHGMTADPEAVAPYVRTLFNQIGLPSPSKFRIGVATPSQMTPLETEVLAGCLREIGSKAVVLVPSLMAGSLVGGMDGSKADGFMTVIAGAARSEAAVFSLGQMTAVTSTNAGGVKVSRRISKAILDNFGLLVSPDTVEQVKEHLISLGRRDKVRVADLWGRDSKTGETRQVRVEDSLFIDEVLPIFKEIASLPSLVFSKCEAELVADISYQGLTFIGGLSVVQGLKEMLSYSSKVDVIVLSRPSSAVVEGVLSLMTGSSKVTRAVSLS